MRKEILQMLNKKARNYSANRVAKLYDDLYKDYMSRTGVSDSPVEGEAEWISRWSGFNIKPNPVYYRFYSHFLGLDSRIVPEDICRKNIEPCLNPEKFRFFYADKNSWDMMFEEGIFPTTVLRCMDGVFYTKGYERIQNLSLTKLIEILSSHKGSKFAIKPTRDVNSSHGFDSLNLSDEKLFWGTDKSEVTIASLTERTGANFIIQPFLKQHPGMSKYCHTSVNPIRVITYKSVIDDEVHVLKGSVIRIGNEGEEHEGTHGNGKFVGIEDNGKLKHNVLDFYGNITHEFNGINFNDDNEVVNYDKIKEVAKKIARKVMHERLLAYDIVVDEQGNPVVLEFNCNDFSMWLQQFTGEPAFGEFTDEILAYAKENILKTPMVRLY